ncbi:MAG: toxin-antitoxin system HicB family antitoxin [Stellaceae bacterium]
MRYRAARGRAPAPATAPPTIRGRACPCLRRSLEAFRPSPDHPPGNVPIVHAPELPSPAPGPRFREDDGRFQIAIPAKGCESGGQDDRVPDIAGVSAKAHGDAIPAPAPAATAYSGRWILRAPKSLHKRLAERAKAEAVSLNTLAVALLAHGLGERSSGR